MAVKYLTPKQQAEARRRAVELRLAGRTLAQTRAETGLSAPTIIKAFKTFKTGGWTALASAPRGRKPKEGVRLEPEQQRLLRMRLISPPEYGCWSREAVVRWVESRFGLEVSERSVSRLLEQWGLSWSGMRLTPPRGVRNPQARWYRDRYLPLADWADASNGLLALARCRAVPGVPESYQVCIQVSHRKQLWLESAEWPSETWLIEVVGALQDEVSQPLALCLAGLDLTRADQLNAWLERQADHLRLIEVPVGVPLV